jgi:hypothetical protein
MGSALKRELKASSLARLPVMENGAGVFRVSLA